MNFMKTIEKTLMVNDKAIRFAFNTHTLSIYLKEFGKSIEDDLNSIDFNTDTGLMRATLLIYPRLIWTLAKTADTTIPSIEEWSKVVGSFNCIDICEELGEIFPGKAVSSHV